MTWRAPIALLLAALSAAVLGIVPTSSRAADPYEIYAIVSTSGTFAFFGKGIATTLSVLERSVNAAGGINGRPIRFVTYDDQSNPTVALQLTSTIMAKKVPLILGSEPADVCNAMAAAAKDGPIVYCFSSATNPVAGSYFFSALPSTKDLLASTARYIRQRHWTKVAYIALINATGKTDDANFDAIYRAPDSGLEPVAVEHFNASDISVAAQIAHIKASGAQVLLAWVVGTPLATVLRGAYDSGLDIPFVTNSGNMTYAQMDSYASFFPKQFYFAGCPCLVPPDQYPNGPLKRAVQRFDDAFKLMNVRPDNSEAVAWDSGLIVIDAFRKFGLDAGAAQIRDYLAGLRGFQGIWGPYDFRAVPQRGVGSDGVVMSQWDPAKHEWTRASP